MALIDFYTPKRILAIAKEAWRANPEYWKDSIDKMVEKCKYTFKVNPARAEAEGKTLRELSSVARKDYTCLKWNNMLAPIEKEIEAGMSYNKLAQILSERIVHLCHKCRYACRTQSIFVVCRYKKTITYLI